MYVSWIDSFLFSSLTAIRLPFQTRSVPLHSVSLCKISIATGAIDSIRFYSIPFDCIRDDSTLAMVRFDWSPISRVDRSIVVLPMYNIHLNQSISSLPIPIPTVSFSLFPLAICFDSTLYNIISHHIT